MLKEQKGITLVALIITIIVMLILAGVSISLVVGDDGVLSQAQSVEPKQVEGALKEAVALANADMIATYYADTTTGKTKAIKTEKAAIETIIDNYSYQAKYPIQALSDTALGTTLTVEVDGDIDFDPETDNDQKSITVTVEDKGNGLYNIKVD